MLVLSLVSRSAPAAAPSVAERTIANLLAGRFRWTVGPPLVSAAVRPENPCISIKDPTIVHYQDRWHLFCTIRPASRPAQIEYLSFRDWKDADAAERYDLNFSEKYFCAPEVFYFSPHKKWYLVYQLGDPTGKYLLPTFSTTMDIGDPKSWSRPEYFYPKKADNAPGGLDFWVICDDTRAFLFYTSLNGQMWRAETKMADFPYGWTAPKVCLQADIFEAGHIYGLKGLNQYLALIEAQDGGRRCYKAYIAGTLDGEWKPLADSQEKPFARPVNVRDASPHWTDSFSHGELLRAGYDEKLEVDPANLRFLFQGVSDERKAGKPYGQIPWQLGILEPAAAGNQ